MVQVKRRLPVVIQANTNGALIANELLEASWNAGAGHKMGNADMIIFAKRGQETDNTGWYGMFQVKGRPQGKAYLTVPSITGTFSLAYLTYVGVTATVCGTFGPLQVFKDQEDFTARSKIEHAKSDIQESDLVPADPADTQEINYPPEFSSTDKGVTISLESDWVMQGSDVKFSWELSDELWATFKDSPTRSYHYFGVYAADNTTSAPTDMKGYAAAQRPKGEEKITVYFAGEYVLRYFALSPQATAIGESKKFTISTNSKPKPGAKIEAKPEAKPQSKESKFDNWASLLRAAGFNEELTSRYEKVLVEQECEIELFSELNKGFLQQLGFLVGHQMRLLKFIRELA